MEDRMRGPKPTRIELAPAERSGLEHLLRRHTTPQQMALRARIVLACATAANNSQIARALGVNVDTVRLWRTRWLLCAAASLDDLPVLDRLTDAPRSGNPGRITDAQVCRILELACEAPECSGRPISHWSEREIADEIKARGIVDVISDRHAARRLKRGRCSRTASATG
jgi:putative transposase